jgi:hypothetical protein
MRGRVKPFSTTLKKRISKTTKIAKIMMNPNVPGAEPVVEQQEQDIEPPKTSFKAPRRPRHPEIDTEPEPNTGRGFRLRLKP